MHKRIPAAALAALTAADAQPDPAVDDAARVSAAGLGRRMARALLPPAMPAAASGALPVFLTACNEVTVPALPWSRGSETIGTPIFNHEEGGAATPAAARSNPSAAARPSKRLVAQASVKAMEPSPFPGFRVRPAAARAPREPSCQSRGFRVSFAP